MTTTAWNKMLQLNASDGWNLVSDSQAVSKSARVAIPVAGTTERGDGSTTGLAIIYGATLPVPTLVFRTDINAYETWDGTNWNPEVGSVIASTDDGTTKSGITTTDTLLTLIGSVTLIAGHTYNLHCKFNHASTSSGTNMAMAFAFKKSVTSDNTAAGTGIGSFTLWTAPLAASGKDDAVEALYKATVTETINYKCTVYRVVGSDSIVSTTRQLSITDLGTRV